jgi:hypothetical protein
MDGPYTENDLEVLNELPGTSREIAESLGIKRPAVRSRLNRINNHEEKTDILKREDEHEKTVYFSDDPEHVSQISSRAKQTVTRRANERLQELELDLSRMLRTTKPTTVDVSAPNAGEDFVIHRSDTHVGQVRYDDAGREVFNTDTALDREETITHEVLKAAEERKQYRDIRTAHLLLGGDMVTNENIYNHQPFHIDRTLDEQILTVAELYYDQILLLSEEFERVQVVMQPGNHGEIRASGQSEEANADRIAYAIIDLMVRLQGPENVHVVRSDATNYVNFEMRGWKGHLRHGQDLHAHVGTSAPGDQWKTHRLVHEFDLAYWGHYHSPLQHWVHDALAVRSGAVIPPGDFEDKIGEWTAPGALVHTITDDERMAWSRPIEFR